MKRALILDTETSGLDPLSDQVLEVGCILYDLGSATTVTAYSSLLFAESNAAEAINRIPVGALRAAPDPDQVWSEVYYLASEADVILAHRAEFDRSFVPAELGKYPPWVCTKFDMKWPKQTGNGPALVQLALEHDLGVAYAHRALTDCDLIARLLTRSRELGGDLVEMVRYGMRPKARFQALVSYDDREQAKVAGFAWSPEQKIWARTMAVEDAAKLPFPTKVMSQ
jgi:DNA polymerase-3 subunit epsilon